jgi:Flp pilus assembly protein TadG
MRNQRKLVAQSLVEFAFILPLMLLLVTSFLDIGRALYFYSSLTNATREGSRSGLVMNLDEYDTNPSKKTAVDTAIKNNVRKFAFGMTDLVANDIAIVITKNSKTLMFEKISTTTTYCYDPITPWIISIVGTTCKGSQGIQLTAKSVMYF